jgi:hypothetical protein
MSANAHLLSQEEVMAYFDGEIAGERADSIVSHLETCDDCRQTAFTFRTLSQQMASWQLGATSADFEQRVQKKLFDEKIKTPRKLWLSQLLPRRASRWALAFVSACVVLVSLSLVSQRRASIGFEHSLGAPMPTSAPSAQSDSYRGWMAPAAPPPTSAPSGPLTSLHERIYSVDGSPDAFALDSSVNGAIGSVSKLQQAQESEALAQQPMIARSARLNMVVKQFDDARSSLNAILARHQGYAAELSVNSAEGAPRSLHAALRIPAPELAAAIADLKSLGRVESESQSGEEVTTQHADLVARLKNSRETEQRLQAILRERAGKISDVLAVEQEIARIRGGIEQMEAEQKTLEHRVDFAVVQLNLGEEYKAHLGSALPAIPTRLRNALVNGYREAVESVVGIGLFAAGYGPLLLLWVAILFFPVRAGWRRWKRSTAVA